jgi:hypothetical protein
VSWKLGGRNRLLIAERIQPILLTPRGAGDSVRWAADDVKAQTPALGKKRASRYGKAMRGGIGTTHNRERFLRE